MSTKDKVYEFIVRFTTEHLYPPTFSEIGEGVGLASKATVFVYVHQLDEEGKIKLDDSGKTRRIKLVGYQMVKVGDDKSNLE